MDEIVRQAMSRWPNVPHCYGWLRLDGRGAWRMRDERAQALELAGDRIAHEALLAFINRNYGHDDSGRWYFQNGPQRVYVDLEVAPYIAHTSADSALTLVLHTGETVDAIDAAWMDEDGRLSLRAGERVATLDDRDLATLLPALHMAELGGEALEQALLQWLQGDDTVAPVLHYRGQATPVTRIKAEALPQVAGFVARPRESED